LEELLNSDDVMTLAMNVLLQYVYSGKLMAPLSTSVADGDDSLRAASLAYRNRIRQQLKRIALLIELPALADLCDATIEIDPIDLKKQEADDDNGDDSDGDDDDSDDDEQEGMIQIVVSTLESTLKAFIDSSIAGNSTTSIRDVV
jgi:hypothetical protein